MNKTKSVAEYCKEDVSKKIKRLEQVTEKLVKCKEQLHNYCKNQRLKYKRLYFVSLDDIMKILAYGEPGLEGADIREFNKKKTFKVLYKV